MPRQLVIRTLSFLALSIVLFSCLNSVQTNAFSIKTHSVNSFKTKLEYVVAGTHNDKYKFNVQCCTSRRRRNPTELYNSKSNTNVDLESLKPQLYSQRWVQLAYLSLLALLSDWICFAVAAVPSTFSNAYDGHTSASIIDIFLFTNVVSSFLVTDSISKFGLSKCIKFAAVLMSVGCVLRSGLSFATMDLGNVMASLGDFGISSGIANAVSDVATAAPTASLVPYWAMVAGTILVGFSQPFFQCTPPLLSAKWFGSDERATSTAVALNFNQIGIATAFLVGGSMATTLPGLGQYLTLTTALCVLITIGTLIQFQEKPPSPPSTSEIEKLIQGEEEPPFLESVQKLFQTNGFTKSWIAFICSISITNIVGAFIEEVLARGGITQQFQIDLAGAGFELAILVGGIIIGGFVDRTKEYKRVTMICLIISIFLCLPLGLTEHALGKEPILLLVSLLGLGVCVGPVQPINAELAVDVTYPSDETAVESVQQIGGNLFSALIIPVAEWAARQDYELFPSNRYFESDIRGDVILLSLIAVASTLYYSTFDAPLLRTLADCEDDNSCELPPVVYCSVEGSDQDDCLDDPEFELILNSDLEATSSNDITNTGTLQTEELEEKK